jgi:hypothetical protein
MVDELLNSENTTLWTGTEDYHSMGPIYPELEIENRNGKHEFMVEVWIEEMYRSD